MDNGNLVNNWKVVTASRRRAFQEKLQSKLNRILVMDRVGPYVKKKVFLYNIVKDVGTYYHYTQIYGLGNQTQYLGRAITPKTLSSRFSTMGQDV